MLHYNLPSNPARKVPKMGSKDAGDVTPELAHVLDTLAETFAGLGREAGPSAVDAEREAMRRLGRDADA